MTNKTHLEFLQVDINIIGVVLLRSTGENEERWTVPNYHNISQPQKILIRRQLFSSQC